MIVSCPNCQTKYNFDEARLKNGKAKLRCSRCGNVFSFGAPQESDLDDLPLSQDKTSQSLPGSDMDDILEEDVKFSGSLGGNPKGVLMDTDPYAQTEEFTDEDFAKEAGLDEASLVNVDVKPRSGRLKGILIGVAAVLLLAGLGVLGYVFAPTLKAYLPAWVLRGETKVDNATEVVVPAPDKVSKIALENVRQYFVANEKIGQLFVIEGKAVNNFPTAKKLVQIEASLFDQTGKRVDGKTMLCGNTVSLFQLQILTQEELEAALTAKVGILTNNDNLKTGADVPFMILFYNPPDTVKEFGLKVVEAVDVEAK